MPHEVIVEIGLGLYVELTVGGILYLGLTALAAAPLMAMG